MKKILTPFLSFALLLVTVSAVAQDRCADGRYSRNYFDSVSVTSSIVFGVNTTNGGADTLKLDVYEPIGDTLAERPVILVAFGGSFVGGNRQQVGSLCNEFAKMGYVAVAHDYRIGLISFPPDEESTTLMVVKAMHDMKAAIRFMRKSVVEMANPYGIDTTLIIASGVSAGAITAIHAAYLNDSSEIPAYLPDSVVDAWGGIEGLSGNPGYSSAVHAVISYSGAIGDTLWIQPGDAPMLSFHEVNDDVVPFGTEEVKVTGIPTGLIASGDGDIHNYMESIGLVNTLYSFPTSGHTAYLQNDYPLTITRTISFLKDETAVCGTATVGVNDLMANGDFTIYPNPAENQINIKSSYGDYTAEIFNALGQLTFSAQNLYGNQNINLNLSTGVYIVKMSDGVTGKPLKTQKLIIR